MKRIIVSMAFLLASLPFYAQIPNMGLTIDRLNRNVAENDSFFLAHGFRQVKQLNLSSVAQPHAVWSFAPTGTGSICRFTCLSQQKGLVLETPSSYIMAGWMEELRRMGMRWARSRADGPLLLEEFQLGEIQIIYRRGAGMENNYFELRLEKNPTAARGSRPMRRFSSRTRTP